MIRAETKRERDGQTEAQPLLPFAPRILASSPWRPSQSQEDAGELLDHFLQRMAEVGSGLTTFILTGPEGSGKSRLAHEVLAANPHVTGKSILVRKVAPLDLFAEINNAAAKRQALIVEDRRPPEKWFLHDAFALPSDLTSRLSSVPRLTLDRPGTSALMRALRADLELHGHKLHHAAIKDTASELPRLFSAPRLFCQALDRAPSDRNLRQRMQLALADVHEHLAPDATRECL